MRVQELLKRMESEAMRWVHLQFVDLSGLLQQISVPAHELNEDSFNEGVGKLDGSSIKGFQDISESDLMLVPDQDTFVAIPWEERSARLFCNISQAFGGGQYAKDSRYVAQRAEDAVKSAGYSVMNMGPELEFFIFDSLAVNTTTAYRGQGYTIDSREAAWNSYGQNYPTDFKTGYYPAPPRDMMAPIRTQICEVLEDSFGITTEAHHHEVATAGQCEIGMRYAPLKRCADNAVSYKYVVKNVAAANGLIATFMPKPMFGDNGSGMHTHISLWKNDVNTFYDPNDKYAEISQTCRYFIGGMLEHGRSLNAFTNPTTNSYKRLVPGYEAPIYAAWSKRNRSAAIRVPMYQKGSEKSKRIEYRPPDPLANSYLAFAAMCAAGLDGIKSKADCGDPIDENIYEFDSRKKKEYGIKEMCGSLKEALEELESDNKYIKNIFPPELLESYIEVKMDEHVQNSIRPTPWEFKEYMSL